MNCDLQLGAAVGFLVPPEVVSNIDDLDFIGYRLSLLMYGGAAVTTLQAILVIFRKCYYTVTDIIMCYQ